MKRYLMLCVALCFFFSCDEQVETQQPKSPCEKAKEHIVFCAGYLPSFTCDEDLAEKIMSTPCEKAIPLASA